MPPGMEAQSLNHWITRDLLARTEAKKTAKVSEGADEDLAMRISRIENHLGLD